MQPPVPGDQILDVGRGQNRNAQGPRQPAERGAGDQGSGSLYDGARGSAGLTAGQNGRHRHQPAAQNDRAAEWQGAPRNPQILQRAGRHDAQRPFAGQQPFRA